MVQEGKYTSSTIILRVVRFRICTHTHTGGGREREINTHSHTHIKREIFVYMHNIEEIDTHTRSIYVHVHITTTAKFWTGQEFLFIVYDDTHIACVYLSILSLFAKQIAHSREFQVKNESGVFLSFSNPVCVPRHERASKYVTEWLQPLGPRTCFAKTNNTTSSFTGCW